MCTEWCKENGYLIAKIYKDEAMSGRTDERPEFQDMIANAPESDIVLVYQFDRFSRDRFDSAIYKQKLRKRNVRVVSATETLPDSPEAMIVESVYEAMAALESANTSRRVKRGMEGNALKCHYNGNRLFGYDVDENGLYVENQEQSAVVQEVYERKVLGESINAIARDLARRGIGAKGKPATYSFVHNMLKNERYTGVYIWGDIRIEGGMPQIIEPELFRQAQVAKSRKYSEKANRRNYTLTGKLLCGKCAHNMSGASAHGRSGKYYYYRCKNCGAEPVRAEWLESGVAASIRELLDDRETALRVAETVADAINGDGSDARLKAYKSQLKQAETSIEALVDAVAEGFDPKRAQQKLEALEKKVESLEKRILVMESTAKFDKDDFADFLQFGATLTDNKLLDVFVYQVLLTDESVLVTLNYDYKKDEPVRLELPPVRPDVNWWAIHTNSRTEFTIHQGSIIIRFPRAA